MCTTCTTFTLFSLRHPLQSRIAHRGLDLITTCHFMLKIILILSRSALEDVYVRKTKAICEPEFFAKRTPDTAIVDFEPHPFGYSPPVYSHLAGKLVNFLLHTICQRQTSS